MIRKTSRRQRGMSLLEVGIALSLAAVVTAGVTFYATHAADKMKRRGDAQQLNAVAQAAEAYVTAKRADILNGSSTAQEVSLDTLKREGFLPNAITGQISNGQQLKLLVRHDNAGSKDVAKALVLSTGGEPFSDEEGGQIATLAGGAAGFIQQGNGEISGLGGGWREGISGWTGAEAGHLAALVGAGYGQNDSQDAPWLARKNTGDDEQNKMRTHLNMGGYSISNATSISAYGGGRLSMLSGQDSTKLEGKKTEVNGQSSLDLISPQKINIKSKETYIGDDGTSTLKLNGGKITVAYGDEDWDGVLIASNIPVNGSYSLGNHRIPWIPWMMKSGTKSGLMINKNIFMVISPKTEIFSPEKISLTSETVHIGSHRGGMAEPIVTINSGTGAPGSKSASGGAVIIGKTYHNRYENADLFVHGDIWYNNNHGWSDRRLKEEIQDLPHALEQISRLQGRTFILKSEPGKRKMGLIAQEVEEVYPELVREDDQGIKAVSYISLIAPLIESVKTLKAQNEALAADNQHLQAQMETHSRELAQLKLSLNEAGCATQL